LPGTDILDRAVDYRGHQHIEVLLRRGDSGGEQRAQTVGFGLVMQQADERSRSETLSARNSSTLRAPDRNPASALN
jgi:hypothetical protein